MNALTSKIQTAPAPRCWHCSALRRTLITRGLAAVISLALTFVAHGRFLDNLVYSLCISLLIEEMLDGGRRTGYHSDLLLQVARGTRRQRHMLFCSIRWPTCACSSRSTRRRRRPCSTT